MYCVISIVSNKGGAYIYSAHDLFEFIPHMLSKWHESKLHSWHACQSVCIWMCNIWKLAMLHSCSIHHCSYNVFRCTVRRRSQGIGYSTLIPHALLILQYLTSYMLILHISTRLITPIQKWNNGFVVLRWRHTRDWSYSETTWAGGIAQLTHHEVHGGGKNPETGGRGIFAPTADRVVS